MSKVEGRAKSRVKGRVTGRVKGRVTGRVSGRVKGRVRAKCQMFAGALRARSLIHGVLIQVRDLPARGGKK